ncbi:hypothetical protein HYH02_012727 [Chlamydomonas schloesseri]|uniref:Bidirectional sugar transporter SWEET n=1 Tax=Chlamydomonas schloesseri TaxID=2026947 RepID=A0A835T652_9CHLO|nr:hypothetical protein HYH02_012727 [Chlamydomonas schloesseri]|eukprot:KAG2433185.1 hypothetical protein HYH02_012727 [Chlamydomonas schloesseri]
MGLENNVFLTDVVPAFGNLLATLMLISPLPAVLRLRATGRLGDINPLPYPLTIYNASGWLAYGYATSNPYLFPSNYIGFIAGVFFTVTAHSAAPRGAQDRVAAIFMVGAFHFIGMGIIALFWLSNEAADKMWGINATVILMVYYVIPLSTMFEVIKKKNAISIYIPLAIGATANGCLWTAYGFALKDFNIWFCNAFGAVIGVIQLVLRGVYGARDDSSGAGLPPPPGASAVVTALSRAASGGLGGGGGGGAPARKKTVELPSEHPSAKYPGAKEGRGSSILMLLNPYTYLHSHERAPSTSNGSLAMRELGAPMTGGLGGGGGGGGSMAGGSTGTDREGSSSGPSSTNDLESRGAGMVRTVSGVAPKIASVVTNTVAGRQ